MLKGTGHISNHLSCNFGRNDDGTLHFTTKKNIEKMVDCYCNMIGTKSKLKI